MSHSRRGIGLRLGSIRERHCPEARIVRRVSIGERLEHVAVLHSGEAATFVGPGVFVAGIAFGRGQRSITRGWPLAPTSGPPSITSSKLPLPGLASYERWIPLPPLLPSRQA